MCDLLRVASYCAVILFTPTSAFCDEPQVSNSADCLEAFISNCQRLSTNVAVAGNVKFTSKGSPGMRKDLQWFVVIGENASGKDKRIYSEARELYSVDPTFNWWDRRYERGEQVFTARGHYTKPLKEVIPPRYDENGLLIDGLTRFVKIPTPYCLTILSGSGLDAALPTLKRVVDRLRVLKEELRNGDIAAFQYDHFSGRELLFSKKDHYLPVKVACYFKEPVGSDLPTAENFKKKWFEAETTWERIAADVYAPVKMTNRVIRVNRTTNSSGYELEIHSVWRKLPETKPLFVDESILAAPLEGPLSRLRLEMQTELDRKLEEAEAIKK